MRVVFVFFILVIVLMVGLPFGPSDEAYYLTRFAGLDVSMAPITTDTSMMTDENGEVTYSKRVHVRVWGRSTTVDVPPEKLDFYLHKIPLHHYYEILSYGKEMREGVRFLCSAFQRYLKTERISGFAMVTDHPEDKQMGFNETQRCP